MTILEFATPGKISTAHRVIRDNAALLLLPLSLHPTPILQVLSDKNLGPCKRRKKKSRRKITSAPFPLITTKRAGPPAVEVLWAVGDVVAGMASAGEERSGGGHGDLVHNSKKRETEREREREMICGGERF